MSEMQPYGEPVDSIHFTEQGHGPLPMFGGGSVQVFRFAPDAPSENFPSACITVRTIPFGSWGLTPDGARAFAAQLRKAADDADAARPNGGRDRDG